MDENERRRRRKFEKRVHLLREKSAALLEIDKPEQFLPVVVPAIRRPLTCLADERKSALADHLKKLIDRAGAERDVLPGARPTETEPQAAPEANGSPPPMVHEACTLCRGSCCVNGGDGGYLTVETLLRHLDANRELEPADLPDMFLAYVEEETVENSCIFHDQNGCSLPRNIRSATCNDFECTGLSRLLKELSGEGLHPIFLIADEKNMAVRYAFVSI